MTHSILNKDYTQEYLEEHFNFPKNVTVSGCNTLANDLESVDYLKSLSAVKAFPVFGFGTELSKLLISDEKIFENPLLIFSDYLTIDLLKSLGFGPTQAKTYIKTLKSTYKNGIPFSSLIKTLNIDGCGKTIIEQYTRFEYGMPYSTSGLTKDVWNQLLHHYNTDSFGRMLNILNDYGYSVINDVEEVEITNETIKVVLTGSPKEFGFSTKDEFLKANPNYLVVKKLIDADFLITDDLSSSSSKMKSAAKLGITIKTYK